MNTKTKSKSAEPVEQGWPIDYADVARELRGNESLLDELLDDHTRLVQAILFWRKKSPDKANEFKEMADELELEITTIIRQKLC